MFSSVLEWASAQHHESVILHLGCGSNYIDGWCNIDGYPPEGSDTHRGEMLRSPDIWADIRQLSLRDESIDAIISHHVIEHFYRHEVIQLFKDFYKALKPGGVVITEMPNLTAIINLLRFLPARPKYKAIYNANRDVIMSQLYGAAWESNSSSYPYHKYVWEKKEFCHMLVSLGFNIVLTTSSTLTHQPIRDMAIIAQKPCSDPLCHDNAINMLRFSKNMYGSRAKRLYRSLRAGLNLFWGSL